MPWTNVLGCTANDTQRAVRKAKLTFILATAFTALVVAATAAEGRLFSGHVRLGEGRKTPINLRVSFADGHPREIREMWTGKISLTCDKGRKTVRITFAVPRGGHVVVGGDGHFSIDKFHLRADSSIAWAAHVHGLIKRNHARGGLSIKGDGKKHGHCQTSRELRWRTDRQ